MHVATGVGNNLEYSLLVSVLPLAGRANRGPTMAMTQGLVKLRMRATASAILLFILNLIGLGLGPQAVGVLSDLLFPTYGTQSIRYA